MENKLKYLIVYNASLSSLFFFKHDEIERDLNLLKTANIKIIEILSNISKTIEILESISNTLEKVNISTQSLVQIGSCSLFFIIAGIYCLGINTSKLQNLEKMVEKMSKNQDIFQKDRLYDLFDRISALNVENIEANKMHLQELAVQTSILIQTLKEIYLAN